MSDVKDLPKFGRALQKRRKELGLTLTEVAKEGKISLPTLANLEAGEYLASLPVYKTLCKVLKVSPGKLLLGK